MIDANNGATLLAIGGLRLKEITAEERTYDALLDNTILSNESHVILHTMRKVCIARKQAVINQLEEWANDLVQRQQYKSDQNDDKEAESKP